VALVTHLQMNTVPENVIGQILPHIRSGGRTMATKKRQGPRRRRGRQKAETKWRKNIFSR